MFYGPAEKEARDAIEFAQASYNRHFPPLVVPLETRVKFLEKMHVARQKAGDTVYGERLQIMIDELPSLKESREELERKIAAGDPRENNPVVNAAAYGTAEPHKLAHITTGEEPDLDTIFTVNWDEDALVFEITCQEPDMENMFITDTVWNGDSVAILLETPNHSYYQIEVNPEGVVFDADRLHGRLNRRWTAQAKVDAERGDDFWRVTVRIPVVPLEKNMGDPFHYVIGPKPSLENPWHFNVGRNRVRGEEATAYLFNPAGREGGGYHRVNKFAKLVFDPPEFEIE